MFNIFKHLLLQ